MEIFEKNHMYLEPIEKGSQNHIVKWKFTDLANKLKIEAVEATCGCSGAMLVEDGVMASFNEQDVINWTAETIAQNRAINPQGHPIFKQINVYLADGLPKDIKREDGGSYANPEKDRIVLSFGAYVKF